VESFVDRSAITSAGTMTEGVMEEDFFDGVSIPRNRELMRVYRDLELVEQLGSGVPRILESYGKECFRFMDNFIRMTFPASEVITPPSDPPSQTVVGCIYGRAQQAGIAELSWVIR